MAGLGWLVDWLAVGRLAGCLAGWLVPGWVVGWLIRVSSSASRVCGIYNVRCARTCFFIVDVFALARA